MRTLRKKLFFLRFVFVMCIGLAFYAGLTVTNRGFINTLQFQWDVFFPGPGQGFSHHKATVAQILSTRYEKLPENTHTYFRSNKKGPRLDRWKGRNFRIQTSQLPKNVKPNAKTQITFQIAHTVNRQPKQDLDIVALQKHQKTIPFTQSVARTYVSSPYHNVATLFYTFAPIGEETSIPFSITEVDRSNIKLAAFHPPVKKELLSKEKQNSEQKRTKLPKLHYGELMPQTKRREEKKCLAKAIYFEARGEPIHGQLAVAQVVMNRVREDFYPDTVCQVVFEGSHRRNRCQFSFACDGRSDYPRDKKMWRIAQNLAKKTMDGEVWLKTIGNASHYHATYVNPRWAKYMRRLTRIGAHIFYRDKKLPNNIMAATKENDGTS